MESEDQPGEPISEEKKKAEAGKDILYKEDFTKWIYRELLRGKISMVTYLPFVPALASPVYAYFKDWISGKIHITHQQVFDWSILIQVFIIFCILVYQVHFFSATDKNGLKGLIKKLIKKYKDPGPPQDTNSEDGLILYQFTHTNIVDEEDVRPGEQGKSGKLREGKTKIYWRNFKADFAATNKNILYFKVSWIILWVNWFCFYIALLMKAQSAVLFDFFMITETLCFAACYYRLTYHVYESKTHELNQYWWAALIAALLFALGIADQSTQDLFAPQMITSVFKTLFSCVFLGLLIGTMTIHVKNSPNWLKILLFCYVALQPMLFGVLEMPALTKNYFIKTFKEAEAKLREEKDRIPIDTLHRIIANRKINYSANIKGASKKVDSITIIRERVVVDSIAKSNTGSFTITTKHVLDTVKKALPLPRNLGDVTTIIEDTAAITDTLGVVMLNLCLALKYLLMFYFIWLLRYDHLMVYFMRTQGDQEYVEKFRENFENKIKDLTNGG